MATLRSTFYSLLAAYSLLFLLVLAVDRLIWSDKSGAILFFKIRACSTHIYWAAPLLDLLLRCESTDIQKITLVLLKTHHLFHENLIQMKFFFLPLRAINSAKGVFLYLPAQIVFHWISLAVITINNNCMWIINKKYFTVLDRTTLFLSLHISLALLDRTTLFLLLNISLWCRTELPLYFSCVCFSPSIFLLRFSTKLPCAILLPFASNW